MEPPSDYDDDHETGSEQEEAVEEKPARRSTRKRAKRDYPEDDKEMKKSKPKDAPFIPKASNEDEISFNIGHARFVTVRKYKGYIFADIREHYAKDGQFYPGKKGIALSLEEWEKLVSVSKEVTEAFEKL